MHRSEHWWRDYHKLTLLHLVIRAVSSFRKGFHLFGPRFNKLAGKLFSTFEHASFGLGRSELVLIFLLNNMASIIIKLRFLLFQICFTVVINYSSWVLKSLWVEALTDFDVHRSVHHLRSVSLGQTLGLSLLKLRESRGDVELTGYLLRSRTPLWLNCPCSFLFFFLWFLYLDVSYRLDFVWGFRTPSGT